MKFSTKLLAFLFIGLFFASCETDDTMNPTAILPTSSLTGPIDDIDANASFTVDFGANKGDNDLKALTITKDGLDVSATKITIDGTPAAANPRVLFGAETTSFNYTIDIESGLAAGESATYTFTVSTEGIDRTVQSITISTKNNPPVLLVDTDDFTAAGSELRSINVSGSTTGSTLSTIAVYENDTLIDASRVAGLGVFSIDANPWALDTSLVNGFTDLMLVIRTHANDGTSQYVIELTSDGGLTSTDTFNITVDNGTALELIASDTLWNFNGPNAGSMQIPGFNSVFVAETNWDLRDEGNSGGVWSSSLKSNPANPVTFRITTGASWNALEKYEDVEAAWAAGVDPGTSTGTIFQSDVILVMKGGDIYALNAFDVIDTGSDDKDFYTFLVKKKF